MVKSEKVVLHASAATVQKGTITEAKMMLPETQRLSSIAINPASKILFIQNLLMYRFSKTPIAINQAAVRSSAPTLS
jgi:hypothetical protein